MKRPEEISSSSNSKFRAWCELLTSKGIKTQGLCLLSGDRLIEEYLDSGHPIDAILALKSHDLTWFLDKARSAFILSADLFRELNVIGTSGPILVIPAPKIEPWDAGSNFSGLEVLLPLGDPSNLGAIIRSSMAFGVERIILLREAANPFLPKAIKGSSGLSLYAPLFHGPSIKELDSVGNLVALDKKGVQLHSYKWKSAARLLVGEEGAGLPEGLKGDRLSIPISDSVESLNAVVAASIALYARSLSRV